MSFNNTDSLRTLRVKSQRMGKGGRNASGPQALEAGPQLRGEERGREWPELQGTREKGGVIN